MDAMIVLRDALKQDAATATAALTKAQVELATVRYREPALTAQLRTSRDNNVSTPPVRRWVHADPLPRCCCWDMIR